MTRFLHNDGGRQAAGFKGTTSDCVTRAIAIVTGLPYKEVYNRIAEGNATQRRSKHDTGKRVRTARNGVCTKRKWFKDYMRELGFEWHSCMDIGSGCKVHLRHQELPSGKIIVSLSRHCAAVIDGVIHDTYDCSRDGTRCVYGYWKLKE